MSSHRKPALALRNPRRLAGPGASLMAKKFPIHPANPHRVCWGCDKYCPSDSMACGNGSVRTQHPVELFGEDWAEWGLDATAPDGEAASEEAATDA
jgi:hypothetical protein